MSEGENLDLFDNVFVMDNVLRMSEEFEIERLWGDVAVL